MEKRKGDNVMKITRKEFVGALTGNMSIFFGMTKRLFSEDEVKLSVENIKKSLASGELMEKRNCVERSKDLVFSGDSHLELTGKTFGKYEYGKDTVYTCHEEHLDKFDNTMHEKTLYYLVMA